MIKMAGGSILTLTRSNTALNVTNSVSTQSLTAQTLPRNTLAFRMQGQASIGNSGSDKATIFLYDSNNNRLALEEFLTSNASYSAQVTVDDNKVFVNGVEKTNFIYANPSVKEFNFKGVLRIVLHLYAINPSWIKLTHYPFVLHETYF